jgi:hypothetical protein
MRCFSIFLALHVLDPVVASAVDTWATVAVAIGTIGTVVYALFRDLVVAPRRRPKLELHFDITGNDQVILVTPGGTDAAQVRLRVANRPGKDTGDDVVVMVTEVQRRTVSEQATAESRPIGLPLTWSGSNPPFSVACVHPGSQRHIDLLHVDMSARGEKVPAQLDLMPKPAGGRDLLESGDLRDLGRATSAECGCGGLHDPGPMGRRRVR